MRKVIRVRVNSAHVPVIRGPSMNNVSTKIVVKQHQNVCLSHRKDEQCIFILRRNFLVRLNTQTNKYLDWAFRYLFRGAMIACDVVLLKPFHRMQLSEEAKRMLYEPNAGGNSVISEVLSLEILRQMLRVKLLKTEMEIHYYPHGCKITDYSVALEDERVYGVSVTRAMKYRGDFTRKDALRLLEKKLYGVNESTRHVQQPRWHKQILHILCESMQAIVCLREVYENDLGADLKQNTMVLCTLLKGSCVHQVFYEKPDILALAKRAQSTQIFF